MTEFDRRELIDRTHIAASFIVEFLEEHPAITEKLTKMAYSARKHLDKLYDALQKEKGESISEKA